MPTCWRDQVGDYVVAGLGSPQAALVAEDTQADPEGIDACGGRPPQHCGLTNQTEHCQVMPVLTEATEAGQACIDRELYLPESGTWDPAGCAAAAIPAERGLATTPRWVQRMLARAIAAAVPLGGLAADSGYGRDPGLPELCHQQAVR